jgi:hypothetical protein
MERLKKGSILYRAQKLTEAIRKHLDALHPDDASAILLQSAQSIEPRLQMVDDVPDTAEEMFDDQPADARDSLHSAIQKAMKGLNEAQIKAAFQKGIEKGDPQMVRLWMLSAGIDLSERPAVAAGDGAEIIIIRPHPDELTPIQEANVLAQITALRERPALPPPKDTP